MMKLDRMLAGAVVLSLAGLAWGQSGLERNWTLPPAPDKESLRPMPDSQMGGGMLNEDAVRDMNRLMHRMNRVESMLKEMRGPPGER